MTKDVELSYSRNTEKGEENGRPIEHFPTLFYQPRSSKYLAKKFPMENVSKPCKMLLVDTRVSVKSLLPIGASSILANAITVVVDFPISTIMTIISRATCNKYSYFAWERCYWTRCGQKSGIGGWQPFKQAVFQKFRFAVWKFGKEQCRDAELFRDTFIVSEMYDLR